MRNHYTVAVRDSVGQPVREVHAGSNKRVALALARRHASVGYIGGISWVTAQVGGPDAEPRRIATWTRESGRVSHA